MTSVAQMTCPAIVIPSQNTVKAPTTSPMVQPAPQWVEPVRAACHTGGASFGEAARPRTPMLK